MRRSLRQAQNGYSIMLGWLKKQWIAEINIKSNQGSMFITANLYQVAITCPAKTLVWHGSNIVARPPEKISTSTAQIFIQLQPHELASKGISI